MKPGGDQPETTDEKEATTEPRSELQGCRRKGSDRVLCQLELLAQVVFAVSVESCAMWHDDCFVCKSHPVDEAEEHAIGFAALSDMLHDALAHQAKDPAFHGAIEPVAHHPPEPRSEESSMPRELFIGPDCVNDIDVWCHGVVEGGDFFGEVLQVCVHHEHEFAVCVVESCGNGDVVPKVSGKLDDTDAWVLLMEVR